MSGSSHYLGMNQESYHTLSNKILTLNSHYAGAVLWVKLHPKIEVYTLNTYDFEGKTIFNIDYLKYYIYENVTVVGGIWTAHIYGNKDKANQFKYHADHPLYLIAATIEF